MTDQKTMRRQDTELDDELEETFPASDPPSSTVPGSGPGAPNRANDEDEAAPVEWPADPGRPRRGSGGMPIRDD